MKIARTLSAVILFAAFFLLAGEGRRWMPLARNAGHLHWIIDHKHAERLAQRIEPAGLDEDEEGGEGARPDQPRQFLEYFRKITTPDDATAPGYLPNYRILALERARFNDRALRRTAGALPWKELGPGNVSGRTRAVVVDADDATNQTWFAAAVSGGVWKTTNSGTTWTELTSSLTNLATTCLVQSASNHSLLIAGTGEGFFNTDAVRGNGIWRSTDHGASWAQIPSTASNAAFSYVNRLLLSPADPNLLLAATNSGLYRTTNGGASWSAVLVPGSQVQHIVANPLNFQTQFAAVNGLGVYRSQNAGLTWSLISSLASGARAELAVAPSDTSRIYAAQELSSAAALCVSSDAGSTWHTLAQPGAGVNWLGDQGWYDNAIVVSPSNRNVVIVGGIDLYEISLQSDTTGVSMTQIRKLTNWYPGAGLPFVHADHHALVTFPNGPGTFALIDGNDGGVEYSSNGGIAWAKTLNGYNTTQFYGADKRHGTDAFIGGMQDNGTWMSGTSPSRTSPWSEVLGGDGFDVSWNYLDSKSVIVSLYYNGFYRTTDGGSSWNDASSGLLDQSSGNAPFITALGKSNSNPDLLVAIGKSGVWRSDNFGGAWTLSGVTTTDWGDGSTGRATVSINNPQIVWAGIRMSSAGKLQVSRDAGLTFHSVALFSGATLGRLSGLATHPFQDSTAYALFSFAGKPKVLRTTDLGATWQDISGFGSGSVSTNGFPDVAVYSLLVMPTNPNEIWAGTEIGLFISADNGGSWSYANNGLPAVAVWQMRVVDDQVVAATHGRGTWSVSIPGLSNWHPPVTPLSPRMNTLGQGPDGALAVSLSLRTPYDSTRITVNGSTAMLLGSTAGGVDTIVKFPVALPGTWTVQATSFVSHVAYPSAGLSIAVRPYATARSTYVTTFDTTVTDFIARGFSLQTPSGFPSRSYNSPHPYSDDTTYTLQLAVPIIVAPGSAPITYNEIAIVEPGEAGAPFGDPNFYDYCVVEGTKDGLTWTPFEDGYDCRLQPAWLAAWNANGNGTPAMLKSHTINMLNRFSPGDVLLIRFRMFADPGAHGWGWLIDDLAIQKNIPDTTVVPPTIPSTFRLVGNYPNPVSPSVSPFNPVTTFTINVAAEGDVTLKVYDLRGRIVATLLEKRMNPGTYHIPWNAAHQASGVYLCRMSVLPAAGRDLVPTNGRDGKAGGFAQTRKVVVLK